MTLRRIVTPVLALAMLLGLSGSAFAQSWSLDARTIGMGGVGSSGNLATKMIDEQRNYTAIVIPLGLIQILGNTDVFDPNNKNFDPILAVEYAATPYHYVIGRSPSSNPGETAFVNDVRNANLSNVKISKYKGFVPASDILAEGLMSPNFGFTIKVHKGEHGSFQGIFIGVGPYLSMYSHSTIDPKLIDVLTTGIDKPSTTFNLNEADEGQFAAAITGGYRGRFALPAGTSDRDGIYVAANYSYLRGFGYTNDTLAVGLQTDSNSVVAGASNINIAHKDASTGTGMALDVGVGAVVGPWEFGGGVRGLANHITWTDAEQKTLTLQSLTSGDSNLIESPTTKIGEVKVELKKDYRGNIGYYGEGFAVVAEVGDGFGGSSFHGGVEKRLGVIDVRGGARYTVSKWNPTAGIGLNMGKTISLDVAVFGTNANIERKHETAIAASIRFNHKNN